MPFILRLSVIISLVVPAISVTIALFSSSNSFSNDDLPTFGLPIIAIFIPSDIIFPFLYVLLRLHRLFMQKSKSFTSSSLVTSGTSSSGKSIATVICASDFLRVSSTLFIFLDNLPCSCFCAFSKDFVDFALIISITDSACDRSIRPFRKALFVNSPFSAILAPFNSISDIIFSTLLLPP